MDCRLDPAAAYGFRLGDTTVVRNAGASGVEGARSALLTCHVLGAENIFVVKHTKCGLLGVTNEFAREVVKKNLGITQSEAVDSLDIISITNLEQSAKDDVEYLRKHPLAIKHVRVTGWIHDTDTGLLTKVVE